MRYEELDKSLKNGCKRFVELWKEVSTNDSKVFVFDKSNMKYPVFYLVVGEDKKGNRYVTINSLVEIPVISNETTVEDLLKVLSFDDTICTIILNNAFKVLNNKTKFVTTDKWE